MDVAVIALDAVLPGSPDGEHWMSATETALRPVGADRWPSRPLLADGAGTPDHTLTHVGGWIDASGANAWTERVIGRVLDAGRARPARTHLLLANLGLPSAASVRALPGFPGDGEASPVSAPARHAAQFFGLQRASALDAACASGLYAVRLAIDALASGRCDTAIAAGVQACDPSYLLIGFSQLLALSPTATPRPLDRRANGLVVGEGAAAVLLKRLPDAVRDGDRIHAVIRAGGLGNDGRKGNLLAPDSAGQLRAMSAAWQGAGLDPRTLGYVECHATGTVVGDSAELRALTALLGGERLERPVAVGSAKALIGHTVTVAGLAGLLRAVGAVRDGRLPIGPEDPADALSAGVLRPSVGGERWDGTRRAAVSAFGFGGTNAHLIVDAPPPIVRRPPPAETSSSNGRFGFRAGLRRLFDRSEPEVRPPTQIPAAPPPAALTETPRLAVVSVAAQIGTHRNASLFTALAAGRPVLDAAGRAPVDAVAVDPRRWRIPPLELADLLPQQLLALEIGADAWGAAPGLDPARTAVIVGMELDPSVSEQVARWTLDDPDRAPPLTAQRVQGQLPNFLANRLSAQLDLRGPSYTVAAGPASGLVALEQAARLIAHDAVDAVIVACVDLAGPVQGAVALVVRALPATPDADILAALDVNGAGTPTASADGGVLAGLLRLVEAMVAVRTGPVAASGPAGALAVQLQARRPPATPLDPRARPLVVENHRPRASGAFGPGAPTTRLQGPSAGAAALPWSSWMTGATTATTPDIPSIMTIDADAPPASPSRPVPSGPPTPTAPVAPVDPPFSASFMTISPNVASSIEGIGELATALARTTSAMLDAHALFLDDQAQASRRLAELGARLGAAGAGEPLPSLQEALEALEAPQAVATLSGPPPRTYDRDALLRHATGALSEVFGPTFADQDGYSPRTRMPAPPLLLCSRVVEIEGEPGTLGPARIVTEYDLPTDASWSFHDGKPNACVIVESGQADLFLVSFLGVERHCQGQRVYRLLDCDLTFHGERPEVGETLRHDIRIKRFARLGGKILFYFEYDGIAVSDGRPVLTMRNGVAGFFTPAELAVPQGVDPRPPARDPLPAPVRPLRATSVTALGEDGVQDLVAGRFSAAFGPGFADADGSALTLPDSEWRLVHRVEEVRTSGGPYGLGLARYEQVLRDDDWFNPCHFVGDPCMPGTLMLEGCLQAVQVWLIAAGVPATHRVHRFEPLPDLPFELRCRGQVVPGHSSLTYEARITSASLEGTPWAIADVLLCVDGTPVVIAKNVGVTLSRRDGVAAESTNDNVIIYPDNPGSEIGFARLMEYSVGDAERAFGPRYAEYAGISPRCARMPGPPLLQMTRVLFADAPNELRQGAKVAIAYDVPPNAWYFQTSPGTSMPFAILLETALQPCGWLTAWQAAGIKDGRDLSFRNLGGTATQHVEVWPDAGTLVTETTQTVVAESAGLLIHHFALTVHAGSALVYECTTSFGYFTAAALDGQKGLGLRDEPRRDQARRSGSGRTVELRGHPSMPRDDWRNLDRVTVIDEAGGKAGLGFYEGIKHIDPDEWFFTAHFFLDPVMPGSLGLEAALQLARFVFEDRTGRKDRVTPIRLGVPHTWKYRGQVRRPVQRMSLELEVTSLTADAIVFDAVLRADGLPIYELIGFGLTAMPERALPALPARPARGPHVAALLDRFDVQGDTGAGLLRLDPARFPWLADHCPTVTAPALPMAFAAEIAAEAASLLRPGQVVVEVPLLEAETWIHTGEGPVDLHVVATADGDTIAVSLAVHVENRRFPKLSGPRVHMRAVVRMAGRYEAGPAFDARVPGARPVPMSVGDYYGGGLTFHGPTLQGMVDLGTRGPRGASATFRTRPDAGLNGPGLPFVLDPLLLDTATHPMVSGEPELWSAEVGPGHLAYPVRAEGMRFFGPRPSGDVACRLDLVHADARTLTFDVALAPVGARTAWCTFRWTEALVPGGPVLGHSTPVRKAFVWDGQPHPVVQIGQRVGDRFQVRASDLVEPIEGTLVGLCCAPAEIAAWRAAPDRRAWELARFAAKGACRARLQDAGVDLHPRDLDLLAMRPDRYIVVGVGPLDAQRWIDLLGPTRAHLVVQVDGDRAEAWFEPTGWPT